MKIRYGLVAALAAAYGAVAVAPLHAQGAKPKSGGKPETKTNVKPAPAPAEVAGMNEVVGSIEDKKFTFGDVVAQLQKDSPSQFNQAMAQLIGVKASLSMFGPAAAPSYTVTKSQALTMLREQDPPILGETLKTMLEFEAVDREVKKMGITVTNAQVDSRINQFLKMLRTRGQIPANMTDDQFLQQNKVTRESLRKNFLIQAKLFALIQKGFVEKRLGHALTPDDFFKSRHILVKVPTPTPNQTAEETKKNDEVALAKINQIAADIEAKKITFEQAAKENSDDTGSKEMGGELGVQMRTVLVPEFEKAIYALKPNEVSKPVKSQFGYHLIQLEARGAEIPEADRQQYLDSFENGQMQLYLRDLLATSYKTTNKLLRAQQMPVFPGQ